MLLVFQCFLPTIINAIFEKGFLISIILIRLNINKVIKGVIKQQHLEKKQKGKSRMYSLTSNKDLTKP